MVFTQKEGINVSIFASTLVPSGSTIYSMPIELTRHEYFGVWFMFSPASAASVAGTNLWYEQSYDAQNAHFFYSGAVATSANAVSGIPSGASISPKPMKFIRFGISIDDGAESITADTVLFMQ